MVAPHAGLEHPSREVSSAAEIADLVPDGTDIVAIDEAHFFGLELVPVVEELARRGRLGEVRSPLPSTPLDGLTAARVVPASQEGTPVGPS